jgi:hydroxyacylglutathione hydrolase
MTVHIQKFVLGPFSTNTYLVFEDKSGQAVLIDPAFASEKLIAVIKEKTLQLMAIWITHAHFDHFAGVPFIQKTFAQDIPIGFHPDDMALWQAGGGADHFGYLLPELPKPNLSFQNDQSLTLGEETLFQVFHTPGHSPGHVIFYSVGIKTVFCGDLIFFNGVGRTDLPGGNSIELVRSIKTKIFPLPSDTHLLCGHGPDTTVGTERSRSRYFV